MDAFLPRVVRCLRVFVDVLWTRLHGLQNKLEEQLEEEYPNFSKTCSKTSTTEPHPVFRKLRLGGVNPLHRSRFQLIPHHGLSRRRCPQGEKERRTRCGGTRLFGVHGSYFVVLMKHEPRHRGSGSWA